MENSLPGRAAFPPSFVLDPLHLHSDQLRHTVFYTGVTSNLFNRMHEHRTGLYKKSFSFKYNLKELIYFEGFTRIEETILREKQIKAGSRRKKLDLIHGFNPEWKDLTSTIE